jgi:DNA/RNA-binding domain of Phe-tRNA-synthetase-like protein
MFRYHPDILAQFPQTIGGVIVATGMNNTPTPDSLKRAYLDEQEAVKIQIGDTPLSELHSLSAWRTTFSAFGVPPTKYRSAAEALLRRLTKKGDIPSINALVDIGNLVSIRYRIPAAVFDMRDCTGTLTVRFANGDERYTELVSDEINHPDKGEVIYADATGLVFARRWCWKQSLQSAAQLDTVDAIVVTEAQHHNSHTDIENAVSDLLNLLKKTVGGHFQSAILHQDKPAFQAE